MRNKKRMLAAGLISVAFLSTVTGCGSASRKVQEPQGIQGTGGTAPNSSTADNTAQAGVSQHATAGSATMVNGGITEQEAKSIATGNAGVTEDGIQYITVKQDWDDGKARYEVEFTAAGVEYDYELDASDGRILSADSEVIDKGYSASQNGTADSQNAAGTSQTTQGGVSIETAKQTVMDKIPGIDAGNIYIHTDYETSSAGKQNPSTTKKKPLKVKVETVVILLAVTGIILTGITIGIKTHHHLMLRDIRIRFEQLHDRIEDQDTDTNHANTQEND